MSLILADSFLRPAAHRKYVATRAGVLIGAAYIPQPAPTSDDAQRLQSALLDPHTARPLSFPRRIWRAIVRWL
jgi:hypothetical protein